MPFARRNLRDWKLKQPRLPCEPTGAHDRSIRPHKYLRRSRPARGEGRQAIEIGKANRCTGIIALVRGTGGQRRRINTMSGSMSAKTGLAPV
jgi:hypothetical protein